MVVPFTLVFRMGEFQPFNEVLACQSECPQIVLYDEFWYGVNVRLKDD